MTYRGARKCLRALVVLAAVRTASAQTVRGVVVDATAHPVSGVVVQLMDSLGRQAARSLTNEAGEYRLTATHAGSFRLRSSRIGFRPTLSDALPLQAGESRVERIVLAGIEIALDTMRVVATNSCHALVEGSATFTVLEQARTALLATELTNNTRGITATTLDYESRLDPAGRRVIRQESQLHARTVRQPWSAASPDSLHRGGYVVKGEGDSTTYYAPGLDMLASELFLADHCFELRRDGSRVGIIFEPTAERGRVPEIRGTMWVDVGSSQLQRLEYSYVNLPSEIDAAAGGELNFARLRNGGWAITRWKIRMPVFEHRFGSARVGTTGTHVAELSDQGGELIMAVRGGDTLWAQPARVLKGVVIDSTTGRRIPGARLAVLGVGRSTTTDAEGRFQLAGLLLGDYALDVRTPSLDSAGGRHEAIVEFRSDGINLELRVPNGRQFMLGVCGDDAGRHPAGIFGRVRVTGGAPPADSRVSVAWLDPKLRVGEGDVIVSKEKQSRSTRPDSTGAFRLCGLPTETDLSVQLVTDSALTSPLRVRLDPNERFARLDLPVDRTVSMFGSLSGVVRRDSAAQAVAGADVSIEELSRTVTTDSTGVFHIRDIEPGTYHVIVRKLGLSAFDTMMTFVRNTAVTHDVRLHSTQQLAALVTRARTLPLSFDEHRRLGLGSSLTREELAPMEGRSAATVVSELRGSHVVRGNNNHSYMSSSRRQDCRRGMERTCAPDTYYPDQSEVNRGVMSRCYSKVYLDHMLMNPGKPTPPYDLNELRVDTIEGIEYFAGASEVPTEYSGLNTNCGVLIIHSRKSP